MGDQDVGSPGRPVSSGLQMPGWGIVVQEQNPVGDIPRGVFPSKCPLVAPVEMSKTPH